MRQSSHPLSGLPAAGLLALLLALGPVVPLAAQQSEYRARRAENFRKDSSAAGTILARLSDGARVSGSAHGRWVAVTLEGWVWAASLAADDREGHDLVVTPAGGENLRAEPNGAVVARLVTGCLLDELARRPGWVRVQREGWVWSESLERADARPVSTSPPAPPPRTRPATVDPADSAAGLDRALTADRAPLRRAPGGQPIATLAPDAPVKVLARSGEWVRVQTEGWVQEHDLKSGSPGVLVGVSGAEVRSRPSEFERKLVQWTVQFIAVQRADEVRQDIPPGRRYVLARGPLPEAGFLYIMVSDEQLVQIERLPALAELVIVGRIRTGRSRYLGNPILELVDMAVREP